MHPKSMCLSLKFCQKVRSFQASLCTLDAEAALAYLDELIAAGGSSDPDRRSGSSFDLNSEEEIEDGGDSDLDFEQAAGGMTEDGSSDGGCDGDSAGMAVDI